MAQLFLYLTLIVVATVSGGQGLQAKAENAIGQSVAFWEQDRNFDRDQTGDADELDDCCFAQIELAVFDELFSNLYVPTPPSIHSSYRAYSARAPPALLS